MQIQFLIRKQANTKKAKFLQRFFKTGRGGYAEDDKFLGLRVPQSRLIAKKFSNLSIGGITKLLHSKYHEERLIALLILVDQFSKADSKSQKNLLDFYLKNTRHINNWDLVDLSADKIVGAYLLHRPSNLLNRLAKSKHLWERRIAMVATYQFIKNGQFDKTIEIAKILLSDNHDLIHKAVGWMLREMGKRNGPALVKFIQQNHRNMPRTTLRYAIERFSEKKRKRFLKK